MLGQIEDFFSKHFFASSGFFIIGLFSGVVIGDAIDADNGMFIACTAIGGAAGAAIPPIFTAFAGAVRAFNPKPPDYEEKKDRKFLEKLNVKPYDLMQAEIAIWSFAHENAKPL